MRQLLYIFFLSVLFQSVSAQVGDEVFSYLRYPTSSRANALGGSNVSLVERDPSLVFHNPALLGSEMDGMLNLNFMNFISDINLGSAFYVKALNDSSTWGIGASFISYGNFKQTSVENIAEGDFSVKDISVNAFYSRDLSEKWRGGLSLKFLYSVIESYSSIGLGVDAGLSYYDAEKDFSFGIALKNVGAQLTAYEEERQKMPWDIQMGFSQKMAYAPFRLSMTAIYLNKWELPYIDGTDSAYDGDKFFKTLFKHLVFGVDYLPSDNFWLGIGFNPKTNQELKLQGANGLAGFSAGAGVRIKMFDVGVSVARYHPSAMSLMLSVSTTLSDLKP